ncbi:unnamed protein product [Soboliphyme baturini]|uniref:Semaphorin-1A n=1 Tax=Soboliphyme baturini TaxID=241478 RepID=A0A183IPY6_9BILA|nr:unnamed protein product [Soboliphyme baturini]
MLGWIQCSQDVGKLYTEYEECNNYITVFFKMTDEKVLVCGTNAFKPRCRQYLISKHGDYQMIREFPGDALSPFDPRYAVVTYYSPDTDAVYAATVADISGSEPLIYRKPLSGSTAELRTQRSDLKCLNEPTFVSAVDYGDAVYFWFRETAVEYHNCGKALYSRVARVCKQDQGDYRSGSDTWTSYIKARLNCSLPGDIPFYFNELQATTDLIASSRDGIRSSLVYAVLSTPESSIRASAVCAFRIEDVQTIFDTGAFRVQPNPESMWMKVFRSDLPSPKLGNCSVNSKSLSDEVINFIRQHNLLDESIPNYFEQPLVVDTALSYRLTQIAVDGGVKAVNGQRYDVIFVGTDEGRVMKFVNVAQGSHVNTVLIDDVRVFHDHMPIQSLLVNRQDFSRRQEVVTDNSLIVISRNEVRSVPLHHCTNHTSCASCVKLQDPYCAWDVSISLCVGHTDGFWADHGNYVQDLMSGRSSFCSESDDDDMPGSQIAIIESPSIYSAECMTIAIIITLAIASAVAFLLGYRFARWKINLDEVPSYDSPLRKNLRTCVDHSDAYTTALPSKRLDNNVNTVVSIGGPKLQKSLLNLNNGTLPKGFKAKTAYL